MAKMFYSLEEAAQKLGKDVEQVREMAGKGELTEYRDGERLIFKVDQIDLLASDDVDADPDMSSMIPLAETGGPSTGLESLGAGAASGSASGVGAIELEAGTAEAGIEPGEASGSGAALGEGSGERSGINVFEADEIGDVDAAADTLMAGGGPALDAASLESFGSGSGLMDLTRESDETSLGAEGLLDELYSADDAAATGAVSGDEGGDLFAGAASAAEEQMGPAVGVLPEVYDAKGSLFAGAVMLVACLALLAGLAITIMGLIGAPVDFVASIAGGNLAMFATLGAAGVVLLGGIALMVMGSKGS